MGRTHTKTEEEIKRKELACVLFYATWCPFSQQFLPIFKDLEKSKPDECMRVIDDEPELCEKYSIEYYPTVILFKKGKVRKRLDAGPGIGLSRTQLMKWHRSRDFEKEIE
jgi:thiol-disulfide isomerase/thioredoxin